MEKDLRHDGRTPVSLGVVLDFSSGTREARISDLSRSGCFIDSIAKVADGEILSFRLDLSPQQPVKLSGEVAYIYPGIGFGLRFINQTEEARALIEQIILANGGQPASSPVPITEEEEKTIKKLEGREENLVYLEKTPFGELQKSIQEVLEDTFEKEKTKSDDQ